MGETPWMQAGDRVFKAGADWLYNACRNFGGGWWLYGTGFLHGARAQVERVHEIQQKQAIPMSLTQERFIAVVERLPRERAGRSRGTVDIEGKGLPVGREHEGHTLVVELGVPAVDGGVVVGAEERHVGDAALSATA